jgi:ribosomal protein L29
MKQQTREYLGLPISELEDRLRARQDETVNMRFNLATRKASNYARLKVLRREIAQLKYFIDMKRRAGQDAV